MSRRAARLPFVDVAGVGLNATDTVIELPRFPDFNSKLELISVRVQPGGQVASALVACRRWGLTARYAGTVGSDFAAELQSQELRKSRIEAHLLRIRNCPSQISFVLVDRNSGERTILWKRDRRLTLLPRHLRRQWIAAARILLVDGHDTAAATQAAKWARAERIPVVADVDNLYPGVKALLEHTDYLFSSQEFPSRLLGNSNLLETLPRISQRFGCAVTGATLGHLGALAWDGRRFHYCRGFRVPTADTTGAGDIFHAGVVFGITRGWPLDTTLEFSCAAAALNCTAPGARGGIKSLAQIQRLVRNGKRSESAFSSCELHRHEHL